MPKYTVNATSLLDGRIVEPGTVVDFDGIPGPNLDSMDKEGERRKAAYAESCIPKTSEERLGAAIADGMANPKTKKASKADPDAAATVVQPAPGTVLTTEGSTSVPQNSAGGVDAQSLMTPNSPGEVTQAQSSPS